MSANVQKIQKHVDTIADLHVEWVKAMRQTQPTLGSLVLGLRFNKVAGKSIFQTAVEISKKVGLSYDALEQELKKDPDFHGTGKIKKERYDALLKKAAEFGINTQKIDLVHTEFTNGSKALQDYRSSRPTPLSMRIPFIKAAVGAEDEMRWALNYMNQRIDNTPALQQMLNA